MVQVGTPEEYFGSTTQVIISSPEPIKAEIVVSTPEPVKAAVTIDFGPLIAVLVGGTVCLLFVAAWLWSKK